jgi:hypothetical protein
VSQSRYRAHAFENGPDDPSAAHVLLVDDSGGAIIAECDSVENARLIAKALNVYLGLAAEFNRLGSESALLPPLG